MFSFSSLSYNFSKKFSLFILTKHFSFKYKWTMAKSHRSYFACREFFVVAVSFVGLLLQKVKIYKTPTAYVTALLLQLNIKNNNVLDLEWIYFKHVNDYVSLIVFSFKCHCFKPLCVLYRFIVIGRVRWWCLKWTKLYRIEWKELNFNFWAQFKVFLIIGLVKFFF